jgi:hypothetical protein
MRHVDRGDDTGGGDGVAMGIEAFAKDSVKA